jgi:hypothetical protein
MEGTGFNWLSQGAVEGFCEESHHPSLKAGHFFTISRDLYINIK